MIDRKIYQQQRKSLKISLTEGGFASLMTGFTQDYFTPFLLLLGATVKHVAFLNAIPNLVGSLAQLKSADITERLGSRKKTFCLFVFLQALMLLPIAVIGLFKIASPGLFILLVVLFAGWGALANPAWGSMMSDLVNRRWRGRYFGWRSRLLGFITVAAGFVAGFILYEMKEIDIYHGFAFLFFTAFFGRMVSWYYLGKMYDPPLAHTPEDSFTFIQFVRRFKESNFAKFVFFVAAMTFSVYLASPFFAVLMLRGLSFNYLQYTILTVACTLTMYLTIVRWGSHADRAGNLKIIRVTAPLIAAIPVFWLINRHPLFLFLVQAFSGFCWAGFNLAVSNFIYDAVTPAKRTRCIAYFNVVNGIALCAGSLCGGFLLPLLPELFGYKILTLCLISGLLRFFVGVFMPAFLKEVRPVEGIKSAQLFSSMIGIRPILGADRRSIKF